MRSRGAAPLPRAQSLYVTERAFFQAGVDSVSDHAPATHDREGEEAGVGVGDDGDGDVLSDDDRMVAVARNFLSRTCPVLLTVLDGHPDRKSSTDRLIKVGRNVTATLRYAPSPSSSAAAKEGAGEGGDPAAVARQAKTDASLRRLASECEALAGILGGSVDGGGVGDGASSSAGVSVPKVRFGRTELRMPILTLGCMRFQQSWNRGGGDPVTAMEQVDTDCQDNLVNIIRYALSVGVNHIETAMGYGSSELQIGAALKTLFESGEVRRDDLIIQTKGGISSSTTPDQLRETVLGQIERLGLDYVDLFAVHGANTPDHYTWLYERGDKGNLIDALRRLKDEGRVRNVGFSTHAPAHVTRRLILAGDFDYVNLHYHFVGSYTASGDGDLGGNLDNVRLANEHDMGVFIISPYDKGGRLYAPSNRLRDLTLPELEPMEYGSLWLWQHGQHVEGGGQPHTIVCGAARPSDLDQPVLAALRSRTHEAVSDVVTVSARLRAAREAALGDGFADGWHVGLRNAPLSPTQFGNIVWLHNVIKAYGLLDFARDRYQTLQANRDKWDGTKSYEDNVREMGPVWSWCPGCAADPGKDYSDDLSECPPENVERVKEALKFVDMWCSKREGKAGDGGGEEEEEEKKEAKDSVPVEWATAYDMRPWTAFPERA